MDGNTASLDTSWIVCKIHRQDDFMVRHKRNLPDLSRPEWEKLIDDWIFSERDRKIWKRWLFDDVNYHQLSLEFGLTHRQIQNIIHQTQARLMTKIA